MLVQLSANKKEHLFVLALLFVAAFAIGHLFQEVRHPLALMWAQPSLRTVVIVLCAGWAWALLDISRMATRAVRGLMAKPSTRETLLATPTPAGAPEPDAGKMNICIEDCLAMVPENARYQVLLAWLLLGTEYAAREMGRKEAQHMLYVMQEHARTAQPGTPWRD